MPSQKQIHKVIYKPDSQSTDEYMVIVDQTEFKKWKDGDTSIPLALVVDSFSVFHSGQGTQGKLDRVSKQMLDTLFGSTKEEDAVEFILKNGRLQAADGIRESGSNDKNLSRGQGEVRGGMR